MTPEEQFIADLRAKCKENGISLYTPKTKSIKYENLFLSGYFDEGGKKLAAAMNREDGIQILIHESCHLDQFLEKSPLWELSSKSIDIDAWLSGKDFRVEKTDDALNRLKFLELDCEKRSVKKLEKYGISFNNKEYIKKANSYVQFYNYLKLSRKWCKKENTPYKNKNVWGEMPDKWMPKKWYDSLQEDHLALYIRNKI